MHHNKEYIHDCSQLFFQKGLAKDINHYCDQPEAILNITGYKYKCGSQKSVEIKYTLMIKDFQSVVCTDIAVSQKGYVFYYLNGKLQSCKEFSYDKAYGVT